MNTIKLYRHALSGHSHLVELLLSLLNKDHELVDVDLINGEHKQPEFLAMNRFGQVPVLEDGETILADSNAILVYLARAYDAGDSWQPDAGLGVRSPGGLLSHPCCCGSRGPGPRLPRARLRSS